MLRVIAPRRRNLVVVEVDKHERNKLSDGVVSTLTETSLALALDKASPVVLSTFYSESN